LPPGLALRHHVRLGYAEGRAECILLWVGVWGELASEAEWAEGPSGLVGCRKSPTVCDLWHMWESVAAISILLS
jgi:hypothetical protein